MLKKKMSHMTANSPEYRQRAVESGSSCALLEAVALSKRLATSAGGFLSARLQGINTAANTTPSQMNRSGISPTVLTTSKDASPLLRTTPPSRIIGLGETR